MPIGRRFTPRPSTNQSVNSTYTSSLNSKSTDEQTHSPLIRHVAFPSLPTTGGIWTFVLHCTLFLFSLMVQYLNLYKTVWWIPESPFHYAIDFSAIDYYILVHIVLMGLTPSVYQIILTLSSGFLSTYPVFRFLSGLPLFGTWFCLAVYTGMRMETMGYTKIDCAYLYAFLLYLPALAFLFYNFDQIKSVCFRTCFAHPKRSRKSCTTPSVHMFHGALTKFKQAYSKLFWACSDWPGLSPTSFLFPVRYVTVPNAPTTGPGTTSSSYSSNHYAIEPNSKSVVLLRHQCLHFSAEQIREEVALFRRDFNVRLMDVLFTASYTIYYSCILPVLFLKPGGLVYDATWCIQHGLVTWLATFLLFWYHYLPADYLDMLHRSALHLGCWIPEDSRGVSVQSSTWSPTQIYASGSVIKHVRGQFQAVEVSNAAEPGNIQHVRFHSWFHSPLRISSLLMYASLAVPLGQLISLIWISEWYKLIGMVALGVFGLYNHYVHIRTYALLRRVYSTEDQQNKSVG